MKGREGQVSLFGLGNLLYVVWFGLPLLAYLAGSVVYPYFDLEGFNVLPILSVFPTFPEFYELTMAIFGTEAGKRFFVIALFLMVVFLIQIVMTVFLAFQHGADLKKPMHVPNGKEVFSMGMALAAFYAMFFLPDFTMHLTSRKAPAMYNTDLKFFLFAGMFWFFNIVLLITFTILFRMLFLLIRKISDWR